MIKKINEIKNNKKIAKLITPYGGKLVDLLIKDISTLSKLFKKASSLPSIRLTHRQIFDFELLATGGFSPLDKFMGKKDYETVVKEMRLQNGMLFPIPIALRIDQLNGIETGSEVTLVGLKNEILAIMRIEEIFSWDLQQEALSILITNDRFHPLITEMEGWGKICVSGSLKVLRLPAHFDFPELRLTPAQTRQRLEKMKNEKVVAFQTRNPIHRAHEELTKRAAKQVGGTLLIHPVVGITKPGDVDYYTRVRSYKALVDKYYDRENCLLSLLPLAMRMAGPKEALWHAIIRRNYGVSHFIVGRDHASPGKNAQGIPFYGPYDAQEIFFKYKKELGMEMVPFSELVYLSEEDRYEECDKVPQGKKTASISGTQVREEYLAYGKKLPEWFTRPEVANILAEVFPPRSQRGFCIWFTGLPSAGKSTIAEILTDFLAEKGRQVTVLDGDVVRTHLSKGLGFSKEDRDINIRRIGYISSEIVRHNGVVICAAISPYEAIRNEVKHMIGDDHFILVYVDTPVKICEKRDVKGMYAKARRGEILNFTGVNDIYEPPKKPDILIKTVRCSPEKAAKTILNYLTKKEFVS